MYIDSTMYGVRSTQRRSHILKFNSHILPTAHFVFQILAYIFFFPCEAFPNNMGQPNISQSNVAGASSTAASSSYAKSPTTYTTLTEESPLFVYPDPRLQDEGRKAENNEIPDGGLVAWTQVLTGHLVVFNVWGYITS